jgi:polar amino acid transport system substrate-binding protein
MRTRVLIAIFIVVVLAAIGADVMLRGWPGALSSVEVESTGSAAVAATDQPAEQVTPTEPPRPETTETVPAVAQPAAPTLDLLERVLERGTLVVSTDPYYAPQSFVNDAGEFDGFDVGVAREVARRLGVALEFVTPDWDMVTAGHWGGRWDVSIGSMTPTEDRAEVLWFTDPYYYTPASFALHTENTTIHSLADLAGATVGLGTATTYELFLNEGLALLSGEIAHGPPPDIKQWPYLTDAEALDDMKLGDGVRLDAVLSALPTIQGAIADGYPLKLVGEPVFYEGLVFAVDNAWGPADQMLARLNGIIADMHGDGTLRSLSLRWYQIDYATLP